MGIFRLYSGEDGESHMEELDLASHPALSALQGAKGVLSGEAEIGLGDGTIHRLGPGDVNMAEDLTGHGHTTRVVGQVPRVTATIHMEG